MKVRGLPESLHPERPPSTSILSIWAADWNILWAVSPATRKGRNKLIVGHLKYLVALA